MASGGCEVYSIHLPILPIDNNGGLGFPEVSCGLSNFREYSVRSCQKFLKSVVLNELHHSEFAEPLLGLRNVSQITQVRTQP